MTAAMYLLLLVALVCANLPFVTVRWFGLKRLPEKRFAHHLPELLVGFSFVALLAVLCGGGVPLFSVRLSRLCAALFLARP